MIISRGKIEATNDMVQMRRKVKAFTCISICDEKDIMFTVNFDYEKNKQYMQKQNFCHSISALIKAIYKNSHTILWLLNIFLFKWRKSHKGE